MEGYEFPISATLVVKKSGKSKVFDQWITPLTLPGAGKAFQMRNTPKEPQIRDLHRIAVKMRNSVRNSLILSWPEETGMRRAEFASVRCDQMPTIEELNQCIRGDRPYLVRVVRKGGFASDVLVPVELIMRTMDYVQFERQDIVDRMLARDPTYRDPGTVLISWTTGKALHLDSYTNLGTHLFRTARVPKASLHRLRAAFIVNVIDTLVDAMFPPGTLIGNDSSWVDTILAKASERMGHMHPRSLRPYLTYVLDRRIQTSDSAKYSQLKSQIRVMEMSVLDIQSRLSESKVLQDAMRAIQQGAPEEAADKLEQLASELRSTPVVRH